MNWRRGLFRVWLIASLAWAITVLFYDGQWGFQEPVTLSELMGSDVLPDWINQQMLLKHPFKDRKVELLGFNIDADRLPSSDMILARVADACIEAVTPPLALLAAGLIGYWIAAGFRNKST